MHITYNMYNITYNMYNVKKCPTPSGWGGLWYQVHVVERAECIFIGGWVTEELMTLDEMIVHLIQTMD